MTPAKKVALLDALQAAEMAASNSRAKLKEAIALLSHDVEVGVTARPLAKVPAPPPLPPRPKAT